MYTTRTSELSASHKYLNMPCGKGGKNILLVSVRYYIYNFFVFKSYYSSTTIIFTLICKRNESTVMKYLYSTRANYIPNYISVVAKNYSQIESFNKILSYFFLNCKYCVQCNRFTHRNRNIFTLKMFLTDSTNEAKLLVLNKRSSPQ